MSTIEISLQIIVIIFRETLLLIVYSKMLRGIKMTFWIGNLDILQFSILSFLCFSKHAKSCTKVLEYTICNCTVFFIKSEFICKIWFQLLNLQIWALTPPPLKTIVWCFKKDFKIFLTCAGIIKVGMSSFTWPANFPNYATIKKYIYGRPIASKKFLSHSPRQPVQFRC